MFVLPAERSSASFSPRGLAADLALNVNLIATSGAFLPLLPPHPPAGLGTRSEGSCFHAHVCIRFATAGQTPTFACE